MGFNEDMITIGSRNPARPPRHRSQEKRAARDAKKAAAWASVQATADTWAKEKNKPKMHVRPHPPHIVASYPRGYGRDPGYYANGGLRGVKYGNRNHRGSGFFATLIKKLTPKKEA